MRNRLYGIRAILAAVILIAVAGITSGASAIADSNTDSAGIVEEAVIPDEKTAGTGEEAAGIGENTVKHEDMISCKYYIEKEFRASVDKADALNSAISGPETVKSPGGNIIGGIVPHHLLACDMIAEFFKTLSAAAPEIVVILAPNHQRTGNSAVSSGLWSWRTAFGEVEADSSLVSYLVEHENAGTNMSLLEEDHSVSALIPYISYYLPDAKVVPILLYGNFGLQNSKELGKSLAVQLDKKSLVLASVDFSHYRTPEKAENMDQLTFNAIKNMDFNALNIMGNDNLDSPAAIMTLLSYIKNSGAPAPELLEHKNSSSITGKWSNSTTSYFTIVYSGQN